LAQKFIQNQKSNNMKESIMCAMMAMLSLSFIPMQAGATTISAPVTATGSVESAEANVLLSRLEEIKKMDKSGLTSTEKRELRREVHSINHQLKKMSGGVYLTVGAIIIIVLLLILLL
jgi:predicted transglutaminase-like cysteine proteinase